MSRIASTGVLALRFCPTIANKAAPTVAEINAGTDLTGQLSRSGLDTPLSGSSIDTAGIDSRHNSKASGTYGGDDVDMEFYRDTVSGTDTAWTTLARQVTGFYVVRRFGGATGASSDAFVIGQRVEVWPIDVMSRSMLKTAENEAQKFNVKSAVTSAPNDTAVVA